MPDQFISERLAKISLAPPPPPPPRARSRWLPMLLGLGVAIPLIALPYTAAPPVVQRTPTVAALTVQAAAATRGDIPIVLQGLGVVTPFATVVVRTQISGQLQSIGFREGQTVHQGDFLAQIDPRPYEAALGKAQGQLLHDQALLEEAQTDLARYRPLLARDDISRQKYEDQAFLVRQYEGTIATDQAQIASARLDLAYCHIVAPITGRVGLRRVDPGNFIQASDPTGLVVIPRCSRSA